MFYENSISIVCDIFIWRQIAKSYTMLFSSLDQPVFSQHIEEVSSVYPSISAAPAFWFILILNSLLATFGIIHSRTPVYSLISLITLFLHIIVLLLSLGLEFLSLIFLIIYVGAVAILFLFVIMLFRLKDLQANVVADSWFCTAFVYGLVVPKVYYIISASVSKILTERNFIVNIMYTRCYQANDILIFSDWLYNYYNVVFALTGIVLLTAMLGSIVLALSTIES